MPLDQPPCDASGHVVPHDHPGIANSDGVIRRISDAQLVTDKNTGKRRISSFAFTPSNARNAGMSVDLQNEIERADLDARTYVTTPRWIGSLVFEVAQLRAEGFMVGFDPLPDNPFHGKVWGNFTKMQKRKLAHMSAWFVVIDGVSILQQR